MKNGCRFLRVNLRALKSTIMIDIIKHIGLVDTLLNNRAPRRVLAFAAAVLLLGSACPAQTTPFLAAGATATYNGFALGGASAINPVTITAVSGNGTTATATCSATCGLTAGEVISLVGTGTGPANPQYDQTNLTVASDSGTTFNFASTNTTPFSGTAFAGPTPTCANLPYTTAANGGPSTTVGLSSTTFNWTDTGSGTGAYLAGADSRSASFDIQNAKGWVTWQTSNPWDGTFSQAGTTLIGVCEYLSVDSIVGLRLFFATNSGGTPAGVIDFPGGCGSTIPGANEVPLIPSDTALPTQVCSFINGLPFNAAPTVINAEDGAYQAGIVCGAYSAAGAGYGLSCGRSGGAATSILSSIAGSTGMVQVVDFNISGTDPVTGAKLAHSAAGADGAPWVHLDAGAQPVLVLVNTSDTSSNGLGNAALTNVNRPTLGRVFTGQATRTRDLFAAQGLASKPLTALVLEPLSGTYTVFQNQVTRTDEFAHSADQLANNGGTPQQFGVGMPCPVTGWTFGGAGCASAATDQLDAKKTSTGGLKVRVIGTTEMVNCVAANSSCGNGSQEDVAGNALTNQIGFAFFSFGNVKKAVGLAKYLTVDGVDPLYTSYSGGALPTCSAPCPGAVAFPNIINGSYPIWNILRVVTTGTLGAYTGTFSSPTCEAGATVCRMVQEVQESYSQIPDLVPISSMQVFRQHITVGSSTPETGGVNYTAHNGYKHYGTGIAGTPCGFAPVSGAAVQYECGRDAEGARQLIQEELDSNTDFSLELTAALQ